MTKAYHRAPKSMVVIRDTREQRVPRFPDGITVQTAHLAFGDYSSEGLTDVVALELKWSLSDLIACCTCERERFDTMLRGLARYPLKCIIVAARLEAVYAHRYRSKVAPHVIIGSTHSWLQDYGVATLWAGTPEGAEATILWWLQRAAAKRPTTVLGTATQSSETEEETQSA